MKHMETMRNLLWAMAGLSVLGVAALLAVAGNIGSDQLSRLLIAPVVLSGMLALLCVRLYAMAKTMPFGRNDFRQETLHSLVVLCVQTGYCGLMLAGKANPEVGAGTWGDIFAFLGYFCVFVLVYRFYQKKKVVEHDEAKE